MRILAEVVVSAAALADYRSSSMMLEGEYEPSPTGWVREQVEAYERSGGREANTLRDTGLPIIILTTRGNKTGRIRKAGLMRVEHDGEYALVASYGGRPHHPVWYHNLKADPRAVTIQDGPEPFAVEVTELDGEERDEVVGTGRGGLPAVRRVPSQDRPADPGAQGDSDDVVRVFCVSPRDRGGHTRRPRGLPTGFCCRANGARAGLVQRLARRRHVGFALAGRGTVSTSRLRRSPAPPVCRW